MESEGQKGKEGERSDHSATYFVEAEDQKDKKKNILNSGGSKVIFTPTKVVHCGSLTSNKIKFSILRN